MAGANGRQSQIAQEGVVGSLRSASGVGAITKLLVAFIRLAAPVGIRGIPSASGIYIY